ncbi:MAG: threonine-phosphate decarboxylase CobD [Pseudomonadota bacterium]
MRDQLMHGGRLVSAVRKYGGEVADWLDLSTGINPVGWPVPTLEESIWCRLPEQESLQALEAAARRCYCVGSDLGIVAAAGTQALIELLPRILSGGKAAILSSPNGTYGEHAYCLEKAGKHVTKVSEISAISDDCDLVALVHPNNPDGKIWNRQDVLKLASQLAKNNGHVIVDEAFCDFCPQESFIGDAPSNMIIYRSFGKFFGLAGLRLGFAICSPKIAMEISAHLGPWPLSGPAIEIGRQALGDGGWIERTRTWIDGQSDNLIDVLEGAGLQIVGANGLFVLVDDQEAPGIAETLANQHILVRSFSDRPSLLRFGLPADETALARLETALYKPRQRRVS